MANEHEVRVHTASPTASGGGLERVHISVPQPLPRSIAWESTSPSAADQARPLYDIFITQGALGQLLRHAAAGDGDDQPFGLLAGDLCEDLDSGRKYVLISGVCPSALPLLDDPLDLIPADAWDGLRHRAGKLRGNLVGWYFRKGDGSVSLSAAELESHQKYFPEPWHSAIVVTSQEGEPCGGFFRKTSDGLSGSTQLPFFEVVDARAL